MKPMTERNMDMKKGQPESFFPDGAERKAMPRAGEIKGFKYPDTEEAIHRDQQSEVTATSRSLPKPDFRH